MRRMARRTSPNPVVADDAAHTAPPPAPEGGASPVAAPAVVPNPRGAAEPSGAPDPNLKLLLEAARDPAIDVAKVERFVAMIERREEDTRRRAFYAALAAAKGEFGPIIKTRVVDYPHKERDDREAGGRTKYKYEALFDIASVVDPPPSRLSALCTS